MRINHNSLALNASDHFATINKNIQKSMARLSSGSKITSPEDDAAGLAISTKMSAQIRGLGRAAQNSNDGVSVIQSAEGGLNEIHSILSRMRELAVQAANDVNCEEDRDSIQEEIDSLRAEIDQITDTTAFNDQKLLNGDMSRRTMSTNFEVQVSYLSADVNPGEYQLTIDAVGTQAKYQTALSNSGATITEEQAGTVVVNDFSVEIREGMTMTDVYEALQSHLHKIGIDVMASADGGVTEDTFASGSPVYFISQEYGKDIELDIKVENPLLSAAIGIDDGINKTGTDCKATLKATDGGFTSTSTMTTKGNEITVIDRNGFEMKIEITDKAAGDVTLEVLTAGTMIVQTGANSGEQLALDIPDLSSKALGLEHINMYTHDYASAAISAIDEAVKMVSNVRSYLGASQNRLEDVYDNLKIQEESITAAYSRIMDTDMAEEMTNYTQQDVLSQAAISMIQKSNERPESILQLLQ